MKVVIEKHTEKYADGCTEEYYRIKFKRKWYSLSWTYVQCNLGCSEPDIKDFPSLSSAVSYSKDLLDKLQGPEHKVEDIEINRDLIEKYYRG